MRANAGIDAVGGNQTIANDIMVELGAPGSSRGLEIRDVSRWKLIGAVRGQALAIVVLGLSLAACTNNSSPAPEGDFSTIIVGQWKGTVGNSSETMSLAGDGTFVCRIHQAGFIANMLYPIVPGTVSGTWTITGSIVTLRITAAKNEQLENRIASSVIVSLNENKLVLRSDRGETSTFVRISAL